MRVLLANKFFRAGAGAETAFFATRDLLLSDGHEVVDFAMRGDRDEPSEYSDFFARTRDYKSGSLRARTRDAVASVYSLEARNRIRELIQATQPDVAHLHNVYHQLSLSIVDELAAHGVPTVLTLHDYKIVCPAYELFRDGAPCRDCVTGSTHHAVRHRCVHGSLAGSVLGATETAVARVRGSYRKIEAVITPSRFLAELASHQVDGSRVHVIPNFLPRRPAPVSSTAPGESATRQFFFGGRLEDVKGVRELLAAFQHHDVGDATLLICGDGPLAGEVSRAAGSSSRISFRGRVERDEIASSLAGSVAAIVPSLWEENCPMAIIEARAAGVPVIASDSGGIPELVTDGVDGRLCRPTPQALAGAVRDLPRGDAWSEMSRASRERFEREHTPERHLSQLLAVYESARAIEATPA